HPDAEDLPSTRVVRDAQSRLLLNHVYLLMSASSPAYRSLAEPSPGRSARRHFARSRISTTRQRFVAESGRVSIMDTRSPMPHALFSSCAFSLLVRRMTLP